MADAPVPSGMSGVVGGTVSEFDHGDPLPRVAGRTAEETWQYRHGGHWLGVTSSPADERGVTVWDDGARGGLVYGVVTNRRELGLDSRALFEAVLRRPVRTAARIEGDFLVAALDPRRDRYVLVTDKLGSRSCYVARDHGFQFATAVDALLPYLSDPDLDLQAASDLLLMGHLWGDRTLVSQVRAVRPATVMEVVDGDVTATRYWKPDYSPHPRGEDYLSELARRYEQAAGRYARTLPAGSGIWLSGGLDSRTTAAALLKHGSSDGFDTLVGYGYDANPPTNDNPRIAAEVAKALGIDYHQVPLTGESFAADFERVIEATDGMLRWNTAANLSPSYHVDEDVPVLLEGMQGELVGDHLLRYHLDPARSVTETQLSSESSTTVETVEALLRPEVDPLGTLRDEAMRTTEPTHRGKVMDIHFQNYYARLGLASNRVMLDRGGCRVVQVDGDYLEWCARIPRYYRKGTFPFSHHVFQSDAGGIPYGTSIAKLELCRRVCPALAEVSYERTKLKPARPYPLHVAGFVGNVLAGKLRSKPTYASGQLQDFWVRDEDSVLHRKVVGLVDAAADRDLFDGDAVRSIYERHMRGANLVSLLAHITTLEYWIQHHLD